jgi:glycine/D-amino acid oxidase-like deaminating enzyme
VSGRAVVVGAGIFGVSTARELSRRGWDVGLIEQYVPGHVRSGSGGDTRLLRLSHGGVEWYTHSAVRALELWRELEAETGVRVFEPVGLAWFETGDDDFTHRSEASLRELGLPVERLSPEESRRLFPSVGGDDLRGTVFEPGAGVLYARMATQLLARGLPVEVGRASVDRPPGADVVVWACGAWLPRLFPELVDLRITRRDVFFVGVDGSWASTPGFCEYEGQYYGHGELAGLGLKVCFDGTAPEIDPDTLERRVEQASLERVRSFLTRRFPALADAPIVGTRVCQYELTRDSHFLFDRHPERDGWWLFGGGSGHGFKHGPALGEYVADCIEGRRAPEPFHALGPRTGNAGLRSRLSHT